MLGAGQVIVDYSAWGPGGPPFRVEWEGRPRGAEAWEWLRAGPRRVMERRRQKAWQREDRGRGWDECSGLEEDANMSSSTVLMDMVQRRSWRSWTGSKLPAEGDGRLVPARRQRRRGEVDCGSEGGARAGGRASLRYARVQ